MSIENKLKELKINLPTPPNPVGSYVAFKIINNMKINLFKLIFF